MIGQLIPIVVFAVLSRSALSGGEGTVFDDTRNAYSRIVRNVSSSQKRRDFHVGNSFFNENWVAAPASAAERDGLGPYFNTVSCSSCHFKDGRGKPHFDEGLLVRVSLSNQEPEPSYGFQIQTSALDGLQPEAEISIEYENISGSYPDGVTYELRKPKLKFSKLKFGDFHADTRISPRMAPSVFGLGLLEAIPEESILKNADPDDVDGDGISGRPNWLKVEESSAKVLGRFGWKANQPNLLTQNAAAFHGDLGLTSPLFPLEKCSKSDEKCREFPNGGEPEISEKRLEQITTYMKLLAVPAARDVDSAEVKKGEALFEQVGCASCHLPEWKTGELPDFPELSHQNIFPYTDMLLHDMGAGLADNRPDQGANGQEWRTPPLWGLGLLTTVNSHTFLLHDGRARSIEEAILWHGGEAEKSKEKFMQLSAEERELLIIFLNSL